MVFWFLEVDSPDVAKRIVAEAGQKLPGNVSRPQFRQAWSFLFRAVAWLRLAMGNLSQGTVKNADWSARVDRQYVCGPGTIHPKTLTPYEMVSDIQIVEAPEFLIQWCLSQVEKKQEPVSVDGHHAAGRTIQHDEDCSASFVGMD